MFGAGHHKANIEAEKNTIYQGEINEWVDNSNDKIIDYLVNVDYNTQIQCFILPYLPLKMLPVKQPHILCILYSEMLQQNFHIKIK